MWCLSEIKRRNEEFCERMQKMWRSGYAVKHEKDLLNLANYPFPYTVESSNREILFACNKRVLASVEEINLEKTLRELLEKYGAYTISLIGSSNREIKLLIWIG